MLKLFIYIINVVDQCDTTSKQLINEHSLQSRAREGRPRSRVETTELLKCHNHLSYSYSIATKNNNMRTRVTSDSIFKRLA